jgi:dimethylhistidine N-methyltransferase
LAGLLKQQKEIHPKFLYDTEGSKLFDQICEVKEYYPTRTELALLQEHCQEIAQLVGENCFFVEFGVGSGIKTRILLQTLQDPVAYVPIEISASALEDATQRLKREFPNIQILPIVADYTQPLLALPQRLKGEERKLAFFPGSTLGNFNPSEARSFLTNVARFLGKGGLFLVGVDLVKDPVILEKAYNDSKGVTAAFNLNILRRMNSEFNANFNLSAFQHKAYYNRSENRIEMHILSLKDQLVRFANMTLRFAQGETIHTENSYKFNPKQFENFVETIGFSKLRFWTDPEELFAVYLLEVSVREF